MSEQQTESLGLLDTEPTQNKEGVEKTKGSDAGDLKQGSSESWYASFADEVKESKSLSKFKSAEDMARSYVNLEKKLGSKDKLMKDFSSPEELYSYLDNEVGPDAKNYNFNGKLSEVESNKYAELMAKHKLHPIQAKGLLDDIKSAMSEFDESTSKDVTKAYTDELLSKHGSKENLIKELKVGLNQIDMTLDQYKSIFKEESLNPKVVEVFTKLAARATEEEKKINLEYKDSGESVRPSNVISRELAETVGLKVAIAPNDPKILEINSKINKLKQEHKLAIKNESKGGDIVFG